MLCSERPRFLIFFFVAGGRLCCRAVEVEAFSPLPFAEDGVAVEPRPVDPASTAGRCEPSPRRSMRQERELRQLAALSALARQAQRARPSPRQAREAKQLQQVMILAAALRRAGFPR
jgi:hypothetical protein